MPAGASEVIEAEHLLAHLSAAPRAAGSDEEHAAREYCSRWLRTCGLHTHEEAFRFSAFAGRAATPLVGVVMALLCISVPILALRANHAGAAAVFAGAALALLLVGLFSTAHVIRSSRIMPAHATNLVASGSAHPRVWLVAHLDSKSQPVSILLRAAGITGCALVAGLMAALLVLRVAGFQVTAVFWLGAAMFGTMSSIPVMLSVVRNTSSGAIDNASGVVAVLLAARTLRRRGATDFGVLLSSAEELALAGAHAFAAARGASVALNCDSIDASGEFYAFGARTTGTAARALMVAARQSETVIRQRRMLSGILVDAMALDARGWETITLSRGNLKTLSRIHTKRDVFQNGCGGAVAMAGALLANAALHVLKDEHGA